MTIQVVMGIIPIHLAMERKEVRETKTGPLDVIISEKQCSRSGKTNGTKTVNCPHMELDYWIIQRLTGHGKGTLKYTLSGERKMKT